MSETFMYHRPDSRGDGSHLVWGPIPKYFGYSSFDEFMSKAVASGSHHLRTLSRDFFSSTWNYDGQLSIMGSFRVKDLRVEGSVAYFKMYEPVIISHRQVLGITNILVHEAQVDLGDVEFNARSALFVPEKLVPTFHRLAQQRRSIDEQWRELAKQCRPK